MQTIIAHFGCGILSYCPFDKAVVSGFYPIRMKNKDDSDDSMFYFIHMFIFNKYLFMLCYVMLCYIIRVVSYPGMFHQTSSHSQHHTVPERTLRQSHHMYRSYMQLGTLKYRSTHITIIIFHLYSAYFPSFHSALHVTTLKQQHK